jgi:hypothetical protein
MLDQVLGKWLAGLARTVAQCARRQGGKAKHDRHRTYGVRTRLPLQRNNHSRKRRAALQSPGCHGHYT